MHHLGSVSMRRWFFGATGFAMKILSRDICRKGAVGVILPLFIAACGGVDKADETVGALVVDKDGRGALRVDWERNIGPYSDFLRPVASEQIICASNAHGEIFFLNPADGGDVHAPVQMQDVSGVITGAVGCDGETAAAVDEDGVLMVYDNQGSGLWRRKLKTRITSPPLVSSGNVFVLGHDGRLSAYSTRRGNLLWRYVSPLKNLLRTTIDSSPLAVNNLIYAGIDNGVIIALRRDSGRVVWNKRIATARSSHSFANILDVTTPVVRGDVICVAAYQGHIGCLDVNDGNVLWRHPLSVSRRVTIDRDGARVFAVDISGDVYAFSARDGELLWRKEVGQATVAAFVSGALIIGLENNTMAALAPEDGRVLTTLNMNGQVSYLVPLDDESALGATIGGGIFRTTFVF